MGIQKNYFGTDGIRGLAGNYPLNDSGCQRIGQSIGVEFGDINDTILIGSDTRESSPALMDSVITGLISVGIRVVKVGIVPTPAIAYLTRETDAVAGIMITASHNHYTDNGIKVFSSNGGRLGESIERRINKNIQETISPKQTGSIIENFELIDKYRDFLISTLGGHTLSGLNIAIDCANGATFKIVEDIFSSAGAQVWLLNNSPTGKNINLSCGSNDTTQLQKFVIDNNLDAGVAFDGDGDRVVIVDALGKALNGDNLLYILAVLNDFSSVVATVMSNQGLENALKAVGINTFRTAVGDHKVMEGIETSGAKLGGEQNGHIINANYLSTSDGLLAALQVLSLVKESGKDLHEWENFISVIPQELINIKLPNPKLLDSEKVSEYINRMNDEIFTSGGRLLVRPSGTEAIARIMVEAPNAKRYAQEIADQLESLFSELAN